MDKYSIILFILGLGSVALIGGNKISITLMMSYFLLKVKEALNENDTIIEGEILDEKKDLER